MDPTLLDNVMKCLHLPKRGKRRGRGYYERVRRYCIVASHAVKYAPLPLQGYYNQNGGLQEKKKRNAASEEDRERRFPTHASERIRIKTETNTAARRYNRVAGVSSFAAPSQRCASCSGHIGSRSRGCRYLENPKGVPQDYG